jgi:hypothetical protein
VERSNKTDTVMKHAESVWTAYRETSGNEEQQKMAILDSGVSRNFVGGGFNKFS